MTERLRSLTLTDDGSDEKEVQHDKQRSRHNDLRAGQSRIKLVVTVDRSSLELDCSFSVAILIKTLSPFR